jgi:hypothetical protein
MLSTLRRPWSRLSLWRMRGVPFFAIVVATVVLSPNVAAQDRPTKALCLQAWNAPGSGSARARVAARRPWASALLSAGTRHLVTPTNVSGRIVDTCVLTLMGPRTNGPDEWLTVAADWNRGRLTAWQFTPHPGATIRAFPPSNVRLSRDGSLSAGTG